MKFRVLIASFLEADKVERIGAVDPRIEVVYEPELLPAPRYPGDHKGESLSRSLEDETRWRRLLANADILFDFDPTQ